MSRRTCTWSAGLLLILCSAAYAQYAITEYSAGLTAGSPVAEITAGPDGALWFTEDLGTRIGRITTAGVITEYTGLRPESQPSRIAVGSDGALWFTESSSNRIGRITTAGVITEYSTGQVLGGIGIAAGPDGALWFTECSANRIWRITTAGVITEYSTGLTAGSLPLGIAAGPDGALWFTEYSGPRIGRLTPAGAQPGPPSVPPSVPTLSQWGMLLLAGLLAGLAALQLHRRRPVAASQR